MTDTDKTYYITTPIYYVNDKPHIGHIYTSIACDVLARFKRLDGYDVKFLTGTDEHGQKIYQKAQERGITPQELTDEVSVNFRKMSEDFSLTNDDFIRTTEPRHKGAVQIFWNQLVESGDIYLGSYSGWYAVRDEAFYAESELEKDDEGNFYHPVSRAPVEWVEEPSYFFKLSVWQDRLLEFYEANPDAIAPASRRNEVISFVKGGLKDLSISRTSFDWGVPVPDQDAQRNDKHVMYVWLDALFNYISALGYPAEDDNEYSKFWPADVHVMGKDILRFHAVYWPAFLMAAGLEPAKRVYAHGWWTNEGQKISKSLGNAIDPYDLKQEFGLDSLRYFLMREVPFGQDGDFSRKNMIRRINTDLSNDLGNLAQRVLSMIQKNCEAAVPESSAYTNEDMEMMKLVDDVADKMRTLIDEQAVDKALRELWDVISEANKYVDKQAPWALRKTDMERMKTVLFVLYDVIRKVALLAQPFIPESSAKLLDQLNIPADQRYFEHLPLTFCPDSGTALPKPEGIFPRFQLDETEE